ncbi:septation protein SepH [Actinomadura syzygii]|uniref:DUF3071 domain-containing protein n=1 Tax=Actinomadura syzygii TaxID=1427538 RepID=A0A5D0TQW8_9ACTN|nr:septation protein SepH [Actinomadura syzygii]TYC08204.1 DUF3071 domain-containing protein [Actinomadura syzygii]
MQELRLVAVSEDGTYLVLATAGRGTRFTLPVDDRLRAAVRGHFSRLGQFEIEVESPLRPKEIQARIRSGETAEEIAESAGIPVERVRWFEGPVLQEREYMAQQAQRVAVRRPGESAPGPPLGETVEERLGRGGVDLEEVEWDSWKCEDSTWRVRLSFFDNGRPHAAEWTFDPRRRHVSPLDEVAARLTAVEWDDEALSDTVTPLVPRRPAMKVVSNDLDRDFDRDFDRGRERDPAPRGLPAEFPAELPAEPAQAGPSARPAPSGRPEPLRAAEPREYVAERGRMVEPRPSVREPGEAAALHEAAPPREPDERTEPFARPSAAPAPLRPRVAEEPAAPPEAVREAVREVAPPEDEPAAETDEAAEPVVYERADAPEQATEADEAEQPAEPVAEETSETDEADETSEADEERPADEPEPEPEAAAEPEEADVAEPGPAVAKAPEAEPVAAEPERAPEPEQDEPAPEKKPAAAQRPAQRQPARAPAKKKPAARPAMPAAQDKPATGSPAAAAAASGGDSAAAQRPARRRKAKGKRASVPSWDEIMFGARRPD